MVEARDAIVLARQFANKLWGGKRPPEERRLGMDDARVPRLTIPSHCNSVK